MQTDIQIFALTVKDRATPNGATELAFFSCRFSGVTLSGCLLSLRADGRVHFYPPRIPGDNARNSVWIDDVNLRDRIMAAALAVYEREGGAMAQSGNKSASAHARASVPMRQAS